jgi:hypothetical protein
METQLNVFTNIQMNRKSRRRKRNHQEQESELDFVNHFKYENQNLPILEQLLLREISNSYSISCQSWLPRKVSFLSLRTPPTEAVLGLDDSGDFVISIESHHLHLDVILRAIPSPSNPKAGAPLMTRMHLPCPNFTDEHSSVAEVPIEITFFDSIGVAQIETHYMNNFDTEDEELNTVRKGTVVVFRLQNNCTLACNDALLGSKKISITLWKIERAPVFLKDQPRWLCSNFIVETMHILVHDQDDGFLLNWIDIEGQSYRKNIFSEIELTTEDYYSEKSVIPKQDFMTVDTTSWQSNDSAHMILLSSANLSMEILLQDIRSRRPHVFSFHDNGVPIYAYHLIRVDTSGRFLICVLSFSNDDNSLSSRSSRAPASVAVILKVEIFHHSYMELEWAQKRSPQTECQLDYWCQQLAIAFRRKELQIESPKKTIKSASYNQTSTSSSKEWKFEFEGKVKLLNNNMESQKSNLPDMTELYPPFSTLSNIAVRRGLPVHSLTCRSGKTELVYFRHL